jgi:hypothetical protein
MLEIVYKRWAETLQHKAEAYARDTFDVGLALEPIQLAALPYYVSDRYHLWRGAMFGRACIFKLADVGLRLSHEDALARLSAAYKL